MTIKLKQNLFSRGLTTAKLSSRLGIGAAKKLFNAQNNDPDKAVELATKLVNEFDGMKGLLMKFGQMASYLGTHMPPEAREVLAQLQANSTAMPYSAVKEIIEHELKAPIASLFDEFDEKAFAAASIGQVHKAKVNGQAVAVKVQYPDIEKLISADLSLVGNLFSLLMLGTKMPGRDMARELRARVLEECDYTLEAQNQLTIRALSAERENEYVPDVLLSHSTKRVLTSEFIDALDFQSFCKSASQEAKNKAGLAIFSNTMNAIFKHAYFNGDPQPGNYLFRPDGSVVFLDFGCIKKFEPSYIEKWKRLALSVVEQDKTSNLVATKEMGLVGNEKRFDHDFHWEMMNHVYKPYLSETPFTYSHEHNQKTNEYLLWENKNRFSARMPADFLFINRLQWGLAAVLADLSASNLYKPVFEAAIKAQIQSAFERPAS